MTDSLFTPYFSYGFIRSYSVGAYVAVVLSGETCEGDTLMFFAYLGFP